MGIAAGAGPVVRFRVGPAPPPAPVAIGGTTTGLVGSGLTLTSSVGDLEISANGAFVFPTKVERQTSYAVTVKKHPVAPTQKCTVTNGSGVTGDVDVTSVEVSCQSDAFRVRGTVAGLAGAGLRLQLNGDETVAVSENGEFVFEIPLLSGADYDVRVVGQPTQRTQVCTVTRGQGPVVSAEITDVEVRCETSRFVIGGTLDGLAPGNQVTVRNGDDERTLSANEVFVFSTSVESGEAYAVTVVESPVSPIRQLCTVADGAGTVGGVDVNTVRVVCETSRFSISGTLVGLAPGNQVRIRNASDELTLSADADFTFPTGVESGQAYTVTVVDPVSPISQRCAVTGGSGTVSDADVSNVRVVCVTNRFTVSGTLSGLAPGNQVRIRNNGGDELTLSANAGFTFPTSVPSGQTYAVTVVDPVSPISQRCTVTSGTGTVGNANIADVSVTCVTNRFTIGGALSGLAPGNQVRIRNGSDELTLSADAGFTFPTSVPSGQTYAVTVVEPVSPISQRCTVTSGSGTVGNANITNVSVACVTNRFTIGGTLSGLAPGNQVRIRNNGGDDLTLSANAGFTFPTSVPSGQTYAVTVVDPTSPISQRCTVTSGTGTVGNANITNVSVTCVTNRFTVGGALSGLAAGNQVRIRNGSDELTLSANAGFTFPTGVSSGQTYAVTVVDPVSPISQRCTVTNGSGTVGNANITNVSVACVTNQFTVGGVVTGRARAGLVLQNNGGDDLAVNANGSFTFATPIASGATYAVTVKTAPPRRVCSVSAGSGTVGAGNITNVVVDCVSDGTVVEFSEDFVGGQPSIPQQCDPWLAFLAELDDAAYDRVTVSGTFDPVGRSCGDPTLATQICQALHDPNTIRTEVTCEGQRWTVGRCVDGMEINVGGIFCACTVTDYTVRPCVQANNPNWGGVTTNTCGAPSQNLTVTCD